jgi:hypothetical protein
MAQGNERSGAGESEDRATEQVLGALESDVAEILRRHLEAPLASPEILVERTRLYLKGLENLVNEGMVIDLELATDLAIRCERLLGLDSELPDPHRRLVQAAVRYFVDDEDADGDVESLIGLDDDGAVIEAVALAIGRSEALAG